jgi:hypothetical protein
MKKCANRYFYVVYSGEKIGLCARVKKVMELFIGLNAGQQKDNGKEEISSIDLGTFVHKIRTLAFHDLSKLQADQNLSYDEKAEIQDEALKIAEGKKENLGNLENGSANYPSKIKNLAKAFGETFGQIMEELKSVKNGTANDTSGSQRVAYKLLCIGDHMRMEYMNDKESLAWAFQQFVANLTIYALRLDLPSKGKLQQIVVSWTVDMFAFFTSVAFLL